MSTAGVHGHGLRGGHAVHEGLHGVLEDDRVLDGALEMPEEHLGLVAEGLDLVCVPPEAGMVLRTDGLAILCGRSKDVG